MTDQGPEKRTVFEEIEVAGKDLVDEVKRLVKEGNVRSVRIHARDGDFALEMPLTIGVVAGGAVVLTAPWLAVLGVLAAMVARLRLEIEREEEPEAAKEPETTDAE